MKTQHRHRFVCESNDRHFIKSNKNAKQTIAENAAQINELVNAWSSDIEIIKSIVSTNRFYFKTEGKPYFCQRWLVIWILCKLVNENSPEMVIA